MRAVATVVAVMWLAPPAAAQTIADALDSPVLSDALGCEPFATVRDPVGGNVWVACEDMLFELSPSGGHIVRTVELESSVDALVVTDGRVMVELSEHVWIPLGPSLARRDHVPEDLGRSVGMEGRDVVRVRLDPGVALPAGSAVAFERASRRGTHRVASGRVVSRDGREANVRVGLGERVDPGSHAVRVDQPSHDIFLPPRIGDRFQLTAGLEGLFWTDLGAALRLDAAYHFEDPMVLRVAVAPLGLVSNPEDPIFTALTYVTFGLDLRYLELSAGGGVATYNEPRFTFLQGTAAGAIAIGGRAGATDGVSIELTAFLFIDSQGINPASLRGRLQIPITSRVRLVHRAGGGRHGYVRAEIGALGFIEGRGDRGSLGLGAYIGFARYGASRECEPGLSCPRESLGPTVAIELDWRP